MWIALWQILRTVLTRLCWDETREIWFWMEGSLSQNLFLNLLPKHFSYNKGTQARLCCVISKHLFISRCLSITICHLFPHYETAVLPVWLSKPQQHTFRISHTDRKCIYISKHCFYFGLTPHPIFRSSTWKRDYRREISICSCLPGSSVFCFSACGNLLDFRFLYSD